MTVPESINPAMERTGTTTNSTGNANRVAKAVRPKRGYHVFRGGMLNAKPKKHELPLFEANKRSPILRLPSEIRNRIFEMALGGTVFLAGDVGTVGRRKMRFLPQVEEPEHLFALTRACRQIYHESAAFRITANTFYVTFYSMKTEQKDIPRFQCRQIVEVRLAIPESVILYNVNHDWPWHIKSMRLKQRFPNLQTVEVYLTEELHDDLSNFKVDKAFSDKIAGAFQAVGLSTKLHRTVTTPARLDV